MLALPVHAQDSLRASIPSMHHTSNRRRVCLIRSNNVIGSSSAANASAPGVFPGLSSSNISLCFLLVCQHRSISRWVQDRCRKQIRERLKRHCLLLFSFHLTHHAVKRFDIDTMLRDPWNHDFRACPKSVRQPKPVAFLLSFTSSVCPSTLCLDRACSTRTLHPTNQNAAYVSHFAARWRARGRSVPGMVTDRDSLQDPRRKTLGTLAAFSEA